jgi:Zn-dependent peptidase ImmA (M78 family)
MPDIETLKKYLEILQCIMRIQDWDIEIFRANDNEAKGVFGEECFGCNAVNRSVKAARIYINADRCKDDGSDGWYFTLIHELYHLVHDDLDDWCEEHLTDEKLKDNYKVEMERNINRLARIFVSVYPLESLTESDEEEGESDA